VKLALDHHYSTSIALKLRDSGHDAVAALERGWDREDDESLLAVCDHEKRALLTNNVAHFAVIARGLAAEGRGHSGLIFTSGTSMPRHRGSIGRYVTALNRLLKLNPQEESFFNRIHWL